MSLPYFINIDSRCLLSIISDMVERKMKVFMDDLKIYVKTFDDCLLNLKRVLKRRIAKFLIGRSVISLQL
ncbi:unnamed protein product, partial [Vitis vinifera]